MWRVLSVFPIASAFAQAAGVVLGASGAQLGNRAGIDGMVFGATFLSLATALPEISSGLAVVRMGDNQLAIGDIFRGNAFQLVLPPLPGPRVRALMGLDLGGWRTPSTQLPLTICKNAVRSLSYVIGEVAAL